MFFSIIFTLSRDCPSVNSLNLDLGIPIRVRSPNMINSFLKLKFILFQQISLAYLSHIMKRNRHDFTNANQNGLFKSHSSTLSYPSPSFSHNDMYLSG